jgi:hypothetical protein
MLDFMVNDLLRSSIYMVQRRTRENSGKRLFRCRRDHDFSKSYVSVFTTLQVDRPGHSFTAIKSAARDAGNFLMINNGLAILNQSYRSSYQSDIERLPLSGFAWQFGGRSNKSVDCASVMIGRFLIRIGFDLHFISASEIDTAVGLFSAVKLDVKLEVPKL